MAFPTSDENITVAETALGRRFPDQHRERLKANNGGDLTGDDDNWILYPVRDGSDRKRLSRTANHIVHETGIARQSPLFPPDAIAVAANGSGDLLILLPGSGDVRLWDHEDGTISPVFVDWE